MDQIKPQAIDQEYGVAPDKGGTAVADTPVAAPAKTPTPATTRTPPGHLPQWQVLLHNDDVNDIVDVVETIYGLTPLSQHEAIRRTLEAHQRGLSLLLVTHRERAELYVEQFRSKHLTVTIEPAR